ncbi:MAG: dihydrofolate reductase [Bacteroidales bacterium]|nr:dihydrofolate reductase [Bacteroidales bacterium]
MKKISIIVAVAENNAIGKDNKLLWHISADMRLFKHITTSHTVIMGKNTFLSLPKRPLVNRRNIVISDNPDDRYAGCEMAYSIDEAIQKCDNKKENFVIGGASIYRQFLPFAQKLYVTKIHKSFDADTYFPELSSHEWEITERKDVTDDPQNDFSYSFLTYQRKNYL